MYRPEFAYETPAGFEDEPFEHFFDKNNAPALAGPFTSGQQVLDIPLRLDTDADFFWRAIKITAASQKFFIRFRDPFGNLLSDYIPAANYIPSPTRFEAPLGSAPVPLEPEIPCPAGSIVFVDIAIP